MTNNKTIVVKNFEEKSILVSREFNAPIMNVWRAHTEPELLAQWWAPHPWKAETKTMNFTEGGYWLYAMVGPENEKHWGRMNYISIDLYKSYSLEDSFCDENGNINPDLPTSKGQTIFTETENGTRVDFKMSYSSEKELQTIVEMGFEQGISICMDQLDEYLKAWNKRDV